MSPPSATDWAGWVSLNDMMTLNHTPFPFEAAQCLCLMNKMALREKAALLLQYRDACYESVSDISFSREGFQFHVHINLQQAFFVWGQSLFCSLVVLGRETGSLILVAGRLIGWCIDANKRESSFYVKKCGFRTVDMEQPFWFAGLPFPYGKFPWDSFRNPHYGNSM